MDFLEQLFEEMPFPIQRIQSDRGLELFAEKAQQRPMVIAVALANKMAWTAWAMMVRATAYRASAA